MFLSDPPPPIVYDPPFMGASSARRGGTRTLGLFGDDDDEPSGLKTIIEVPLWLVLAGGIAVALFVLPTLEPGFHAARRIATSKEKAK